MAQIIQLNTADHPEDKCLVMGYREARQYDLNMGDYDVFELGILVSIVSPTTLSTSTALTVDEGPETVNKDYVWFGLKTSGSEFPGDAEAFCGIQGDADMNTGDLGLYRSNAVKQGSVLFNGSGSMSDWYSTHYDGMHYGGYYVSSSTNPSTGDGIASPHYIRFEINNRGQPNQSVTVRRRFRRNSPLPMSGGGTGKYEVKDVQSILAGLTVFSSNEGYERIQTSPLNDGVSALPLPKSVFLYWPFSGSRLAIHGVAIQVE